MRAKQITVGVPGVFSVTLGELESQSLRERFNRRSLYGPCMIVDRWSGLALDATTEPKHETRPVMWTVHGMPWQHWRIRKARDGFVKITSEHGGLALTTDQDVGDKSWMWLEEDRGRDCQLWRLEPTEDRTAFVIYSRRTSCGIDATPDPRIPAAGENHNIDNPTCPLMYTFHWNAWQQWVITRLPLT